LRRRIRLNLKLERAIVAPVSPLHERAVLFGNRMLLLVLDASSVANATACLDSGWIVVAILDAANSASSGVVLEQLRVERDDFSDTI
jgi:hypothetical protein